MRYVLCLLLIGCFAFVHAQRFAVKNTNGTTFYLDLKKQTAVYVFISPECPLCQNYTKTLNAFHQTYASKQIALVAIVPGKAYTSKQVADFARTYKVKFSVFIDENKKLTRYFKATITPEAFLFVPDKGLVYAGRIDNWAYAPGRKRTIVTEHDLRNALDAYVAGKPVPVSKTKAGGCFIE
ncbi:MAG: redoxin domain-containing protein [Bacteroidota bacterium]